VPPDRKDEARGNIIELLTMAHGLGLSTAVRINDLRTPSGARDVEALVELGLPVAVMVPKADSPNELEQLVSRLAPGSGTLPLVETARGVNAVQGLAEATGVLRLVFGHLDLCAELGLDPDDEAALWPLRLALVTSSAAAELPPPVDGVTADFRDISKVTADATRSARTGLTGKLCIHPDQVVAVHQALLPSDEDLTWAREVVAVVEKHGLGEVRGAMVDRPVYVRAASLVARARAVPTEVANQGSAADRGVR
jgi:citrate lyase subunit beta / citryl-CoA lyase